MKKIAIAILLSTFIAAPSLAEDMYAGVAIGSAKINDPEFDTSTSLTLLGGYNFNANFAAEIAYSNFGKESGSSITTATPSRSSATSISGVGSYPVYESFTVFGKLGFASTKLDFGGLPTQSKKGLTYGLGVQFDVEDGNRVGYVRIGYDVYKLGTESSVNQKVMGVSFLASF